jgi:multiple sugar transport system substrate-binding protein
MLDMKKVIIAVLTLAVVLGVVFWMFAPSIFGPKEPEVKEITLTVYGLWETEELLKPAFDEYKKLHPNVTIKYEFNRSTNYRTKVQTRIQNNEGPDVFIIHNSWLPMFTKTGLIAPMPQDIMSYSDFVKSFNPVVKDSLSIGNSVYALPRGIDGLALYYNSELLSNVGLTVPRTWEELRIAASQIAVVNPETDKIETAGVAMGMTGNVDHWSDILGLLFLQMPGASLEKPNDAAGHGAEVLQFFVDLPSGKLTNGKKLWDRSMASSTEEFARGRLAFYFAPSWKAQELRQRKPELKFGIAPVPQLPNRPPAGWGTFWAYAVSSTSPNTREAWELVNFLTSAETQTALFRQAANARLFGLPYSRVELQSQVKDDPYVGPFVNQGPIYKSWYLNSGTYDQQGINESIIKYYEDAVNRMVNEGADPRGVLEPVEKGVAQVFSEYTEAPAEAAPAQ